MVSFICPIEGCDYGEAEEKSRDQVRSHVNASADHPGWTDVEDQVEPPAEPPAEGGGREEDEGDDQGEAGGERAEAAETSGTEQANEGGESGKKPRKESGMVTQEEYKQQHEQVESGDGDDADEQDEAPPEGGAEGGSKQAEGGGLPLPSLSTEMWVALGLAVVVLIAFLYLRRRDDGAGATQALEESQNTDPEQPESDDEGVGLIES